MLTGEPVAMRLLAQTPGTFSILIEMLGLASLSASESAATILYRQVCRALVHLKHFLLALQGIELQVFNILAANISHEP
jgi:hypothetical protein